MKKTLAERVGYTPGPWKVDTCSEGESCWCRVINSESKDEDGDNINIIGSGDLRKNNSSLVAAAPQMLERDVSFFSQLEKIVEQYRRDGDKKSLAVAEMIYNMYDLTPTLGATGMTWEELKV